MRKTTRILGLSVAGAAALTLIQAPAASAATKSIWAAESVKIRASTTTSSTALGLVPKGAQAAATVTSTGAYKGYFGGKHNACGSKGYIEADKWNKVTYKGITGYVPWDCMLPFKP
ncbi:hypothetical protein ACFRFL_36450 [Streptomyces sp. NPDC056708]|uniref:hypothetical protein n=1 Tax=unclassified Streptomyces TaxID=2593676 RepID=UPI0036D01C31